jgi:uncharacterized protein YegL
MRDDLTDITIVLDRSGSMSSIRGDTIGGFNTFVKDQAAQPGACRVTLVQFDDQYEPNYTAVDAREVVPLNEDTYQPRGSTALNDAFGRAIVSTGARLRAMAEKDRPAKVIFVVITDGAENASKEYSKAKVRQLVEQQERDYKWNFVYIGAGIDAMSEGGQYGAAAASTYNVSASGQGVKRAFAKMSGKFVDYRATNDAGALSFTEADRKEQEDLGAVKTDTSTDSNSTANP